MSSFDKKWASQRKEPLSVRVKEAIRPQADLRSRLEQARRAINSQITKLDSKANRLKEKDKAIFNQVSAAIQRHDNIQASSLANELSENRKMLKTVVQTETVLEQINIRLGTVKDLGDIVVTLSPAASAIKGIRSSLAGIMPEAGSQIEEIGGMLSSLITDAGQLSGFSLSFEPSGEEAEKILAEAAAVAERRALEKLPDIPSSALANPEEQPSA